MAKKIALTIYFDENTGEVDKVDCTKRFSEEWPLFRIDVLKDSILALENIYQYERGKYFKGIVENEFGEAGEA